MPSRIEHFPQEVLSEILSYVYPNSTQEEKQNYRLVRRAWNQTCDGFVTSLKIKIISTAAKHLPGVLVKQMADPNQTPNLWEILSRFRSLNRLEYTHCSDEKKFDWADGAHIIQFHALKHIDLASGDGISSVFIDRLAKSCPNLESVVLTWNGAITNQSALALRDSCRYLKAVDLNNCYQTTSDAIISLSENRSLERLSLICCDKITDRALIALSKNCPNMQFLNLYGCRKITDFGTDALTLTYTQLRFLSLAGCEKLTAKSVIKLAEKNPELRVFDVSHSAQIQDADLNTLAEKCSSLAALGLAGQRMITDLAMLSLMYKCTHLKTLDISEPSNLTYLILKEARIRRITVYA